MTSSSSWTRNSRVAVYGRLRKPAHRRVQPQTPSIPFAQKIQHLLHLPRLAFTPLCRLTLPLAHNDRRQSKKTLGILPRSRASVLRNARRLRRTEAKIFSFRVFCLYGCKSAKPAEPHLLKRHTAIQSLSQYACMQSREICGNLRRPGVPEHERRLHRRFFLSSRCRSGLPMPGNIIAT